MTSQVCDWLIDQFQSIRLIDCLLACLLDWLIDWYPGCLQGNWWENSCSLTSCLRCAACKRKACRASKLKKRFHPKYPKTVIKIQTNFVKFLKFLIPSLQFSFLLRGQHVWSPVVPLPVPRSDWSLSHWKAWLKMRYSVWMIWKCHFLLSFHHESLHSTCLLGSETKLPLECISWWYLLGKALDWGASIGYSQTNWVCY